MKDFAITLFFGWLGIHKFTQKKYGLGKLYLLTLGLFGIGWGIDTILAFVRMVNGKRQVPAMLSNTLPTGKAQAPSKKLIESFNTIIVGTFATCDLDPDTDREEIVLSFKANSALYLKYWEYKGEPAYYVCYHGIDAGNIPATLAKTLYEKYSDCEFIVTLQGEAEYNDRNDLTQKIRVDVYK